MTKKENNLLNLTAKTWNAFLKLPVYNGDDLNDFRFHIHALQNIILARKAIRKNKRNK